MFQYYAPAQFLQAVPTPGGTGAGFSQPGSSQGSQLFADNSTPNNKNFMRDSRFNRQRLVLLGIESLSQAQTLYSLYL